MHLLHFIDHAGAPVFSAMAEVVPRVGECVRHLVEPSKPSEWEPEALKAQLAGSGRHYRVTRVVHEFRKTSVMRPESQSVFLTVEPVEA
jgi:hypothetical protein